MNLLKSCTVASSPGSIQHAQQLCSSITMNNPKVHRGWYEAFLQACDGSYMLRAGVLTCIPNAKNPRDLDIAIQYDFAGQNGEAHNEQKYRMR